MLRNTSKSKNKSKESPPKKDGKLVYSRGVLGARFGIQPKKGQEKSGYYLDGKRLGSGKDVIKAVDSGDVDSEVLFNAMTDQGFVNSARISDLEGFNNQLDKIEEKERRESYLNSLVKGRGLSGRKSERRYAQRDQRRASLLSGAAGGSTFG